MAGLEKWDEAISEYREAVRLQPRLAQAHLTLADALLVRGDWIGVAVASREAVRLAPADASGHSSLGLALLRLGQLDEAVVEIR